MYLSLHKVFATQTKKFTLTGVEGAAPPAGSAGRARDRGGEGGGEGAGQEGEVCLRQLTKKGARCVSSSWSHLPRVLVSGDL